MSYEISITPHPGYLHVKAYGIGSYDIALQLWIDIVKACDEHQCYNILGEQHLKFSLSTLAALDHPEIFKKAGITKQHRIAWVDLNPQTRETTEFVRNVLTNRAVGKGRLFANLDDARHWLLSSKQNPR